MRADGSGLTRLLSVPAWKSERPLSSPAWSPDGRYLAVAVNAEEEPGIYTMRPDGTERKRVVADVVGSHVAWSPDGSELLVSGIGYSAGGTTSAAGIYVGRIDDGSVRRVLSARGREPPSPASWSPDGGRIAAFLPSGPLVTVRSDGTDLRVVARYDDEGGLVAAGPPPSVTQVDLAPCSGGFVVPEPEANPGLVRDCETLLSVRDSLASGAHLAWSADIPLAEWEGIVLGGSPLRVHEVVLMRHELTGTLPPELGQLTELRRLMVWHTSELTGPIPPELSGLTKLEVLMILGNRLSGTIPPDLGDISSLVVLNLAGNTLTGRIPRELGHLTRLQELNVGGNSLSGSIPVRLARLAQLRELDLSGNQLSGSVPRQLGSLQRLEEFRIHGNPLSGCIPAELRDSVEDRGGGMEWCGTAASP